MLTQEEFYEKANKFALLKDTDDKYYTYEEYQSLIKDNQTDKDGNLIYLYATHADEQYSYIDAAKEQRLQRIVNGWSAGCSYGKYARAKI